MLAPAAHAQSPGGPPTDRPPTPTPTPRPSDRTIFIGFDEPGARDAPLAQAALLAIDARRTTWLRSAPALAVVDLEPGHAHVADALDLLEGWPGVRFAEVDWIDAIRPSAPIVPDDTLYPDQQWIHERIRTPEAWQWLIDETGQVDGTGPIIAVIDSGINYEHPDLASNIWTNTAELNGLAGVDDDNNGFTDDVHGHAFADGGPACPGSPPGDDCILTLTFSDNCFLYASTDPYDIDGELDPNSTPAHQRVRYPGDPGSHGTLVASVIGAKGHNAQGLAGVAWKCRIMALRRNDRCHPTLVSHTILATDYAIDNGAKIINYSLQSNQYFAAFDVLMQKCDEADILVVCAAGNFDSSVARDLDLPTLQSYPAEYQLANKIVVANTTDADFLAPDSGYGPGTVHLAAPGTGVRTLAPFDDFGRNWVEFDSGTSFSAPLVAGTAALVWSLRPDYTAQQVKSAILDTVQPVPSLDGLLIHPGILDVYEAIKATQ